MARPLTLHASRLAVVGLAGLTLVRLLVAALVPLSPDEAYYFVWSRALAAGYLDHPPMVALWIRAGTALVGNGALGIRLLAPFAAALGSWLLWDAAERLLPRPGSRFGSGLIAATLLNATLLFGIGAVTMTPDTPLLFFWVCTLWALARLFDYGLPGQTDMRQGAWWLVVGLFAGLAFDSKYTAAFVVLGIALWLLFVERRWLTRPWPWIGCLVGLGTVAPMLSWNATHGWASFAKQGSRIDEWQPARAAQFLGELVGGQLGLATPLVFALCVAGVWLACRRAWVVRDPRWTLLAALSLPAVAVFVEHTLADRVQGNWPAIVYPAAVIAAAGLQAPAWRRLHVPAMLLGFAITLLVYLQATLTLLPVPIRFDPLALQLAGWPGLAARIDDTARQVGADFVASDQYSVASELAYRLPDKLAVVGVEPRWRMFDLPAATLQGRVGVLVRSARRGLIGDAGPFAARELLGVAARERNGQKVETYLLYRVTGDQTSPDARLLPRR